MQTKVWLSAIVWLSLAMQICAAAAGSAETTANAFPGPAVTGDDVSVTGDNRIDDPAWWTWTAPYSGYFILDADISDYCVDLTVYTGDSLAALKKVAITYDKSSSNCISRAALLATAGTVYRVAVATDDNPGTARLKIGRPACAANDTFPGTTLAGNSFAFGTDNYYATKESGEPYHEGYHGGASLWWTWTPTVSGAYNLVIDYYDFIPLLAIYTGDSVDNLTEVVRGYDVEEDWNHQLYFYAQAGQTYRIALDEINGDYGEFWFYLKPLATPSNDLFPGAAIVGENYNTTADNSYATPEAGEPRHYGYSADASLWWTWTAPSAGRCVITTSGSQIFARLAVYTGPQVSQLTEVARGQENYNCDQELVFYPTAGTSYRIVVDGEEYYERGQLALNLQFVPNAVNDLFPGPTLSGANASATGQNFVGATSEPGEPNHGGSGKSVWWSWTAPISGRCQVSLPDCNFDAALAVYIGDSVTNLTRVTCLGDPQTDYADDDKAVFAAVAGTTYRLAVDGYLDSGRFKINVAVAAGPENDFFPGSALSGTSICVTGTNVGAAQELGEPSNGEATVWWSWTAPAAGRCTITTKGSLLDAYLMVYQGDRVAALTQVATNENPSETDCWMVSFSAAAGAVYRISVGGYEDETGPIMLTIVGNADSRDAVDDFAARFYQLCLKRAPTDAELQYWSADLRLGVKTGADTAAGFFFSPEFTAQNLSNGSWLQLLFMACLDRDPDQEGWSRWLTLMNQGLARADVLNEMVHSAEFARQCTERGIEPCTGDPLRAFVARFYRQCLSREADPAGHQAWVANLRGGTSTGADVGAGFVLSAEFQARGLDDSAWLDVLYQAFFDRAADAAGKSAWQAQLAGGLSRPAVLQGFTDSGEFANLCGQYGIRSR